MYRERSVHNCHNGELYAGVEGQGLGENSWGGAGLSFTFLFPMLVSRRTELGCTQIFCIKPVAELRIPA